MKKRHLWVAVALIMALGLTGCTGSDDEASVTPNENVQPEEFEEVDYIDLTRAERQLVGNSNDFAFNLFRKMKGNNSLILSPISITYALGMLNNGASGETQTQINQVLGFGETGVDGINEFCRKMLVDAPRLDKTTKVMIANTIFLNKDYQLMPGFVEAAKTYYDAEPETRDFSDGKTMDVINQWASDHTEKMIEKVLSEDEFNPAAISYLLNAIYFKGAWSFAFDKEKTKDEPFECYGEEVRMFSYTETGCEETTTMIPGETITCRMMHQESLLSYTENDLCQAVALPYGNGHYRMTVLLPREEKSINDVVESLNSETWNQYQYMGEEPIVDLKLPCFESNTDVSLKEAMAVLGMPNAFDPSKAEFPAFCHKPSYIDLMKQVARIRLDETGTEAAAVTAIGTVPAAISPTAEPRHVELHANRPFLYVISEVQTGTIFFIGQFMGD